MGATGVNIPTGGNFPAALSRDAQLKGLFQAKQQQISARVTRDFRK
ncbi:MAG: hypothetical protein ACJAU6_003665 [Alphaproteobacteria bacterium]|jgi:hypothetical protein